MPANGGGGGGGGRTGLLNAAGGTAVNGGTPGGDGTFTGAGSKGLGNSPADDGGAGGGWGANGAAGTAAGGIRGLSISNSAGITFSVSGTGTRTP